MKKSDEKHILIVGTTFKIGLLKAKKLFETYKNAGINLKQSKKMTSYVFYTFENGDTLIIATLSTDIDKMFYQQGINEIYLDMDCSIRVYTNLMRKLTEKKSDKIYFF